MNSKTYTNLERYLVGLYGSMARFVMRKQLQDIGQSIETLDVTKYNTYVQKVVGALVYDTKLRPEVVRDMKEIIRAED